MSSRSFFLRLPPAHAQSLIDPHGTVRRCRADRYESQKLCINTYIRYCSNHNTTSWTLPPLYTLLRDLQTLSSNATSEFQRQQQHQSAQQAGIGMGILPLTSTAGTSSEMKYEEDCARVFQAAFKLCVGDRSNPQHLSKRKGVYRMACLNLKWYFKASPQGRRFSGKMSGGELILRTYDYRGSSITSSRLSSLNPNAQPDVDSDGNRSTGRTSRNNSSEP